MTDEQVPVPLPTSAHGLHGGGEVQHRARRYGGCLGLRAGGRSSRWRARYMLGAERVIGIDRFQDRLPHGARESGKPRRLNYEQVERARGP